MRVFRSGQEHGFDVGLEARIHARHLEFILEVGYGAQAPDDDMRTVFLCKIHQQAGKSLDLDTFGVGAQLFQILFHQLAARRQLERRFLAGIERYGDDELIDHVHRALDDVHMPHGDRVERAWVDAGSHRKNICYIVIALLN